MTELMTRILADGTNLLQHVCFFWKSHDHHCSCLLCNHRDATPPKFPFLYHPPVTSSDLQLLHSRTNAIRFYTNDNKYNDDLESQFWYQLHHYLGYQNHYLCSNPQFDIIVCWDFVFSKYSSARVAKHIIILSLTKPRILLPNHVCIWYKNKDMLLQMLIHLLFLTKHRARISDIYCYFPCLGVETIVEQSVCLFL